MSGKRTRGDSSQARQNASIQQGDTLQSTFQVELAPAGESNPDPSQAAAAHPPPHRGGVRRGKGRAPAPPRSLPKQCPVMQSGEDQNSQYTEENVFSSGQQVAPPNLFTSKNPIPPEDDSEHIDITVSPTSSDLDEDPPNIRRIPAHSETDQSSAAQSTASARSTTTAQSRSTQDAKDVWAFYDKNSTANRCICILCDELSKSNSEYVVKSYSSKTSTTVLRRHLFSDHLQKWVNSCDELNIHISGADAVALASEYRAQRDGPSASISNNDPLQEDRLPFSKEAFLKALTDFIIGDDVAISITKSPRLRNLFLLLRAELQDKDIPKRTKLRAHIMQCASEHFDALKSEISEKSLGKVSFTMDLWSDPNLTPYMAVTAHWIESTPAVDDKGSYYKLALKTDLIAFHRVPGRHTGDHLAQAFIIVTDRIGATSKTGWITLDNATNNDTFVASLERLLHARHIDFDKHERRVRCFPHIVNLACKAVLSAFTKMDFAAVDAELFTPSGHLTDTASFLDAIDRDPIASLRSAIRNIRSSSLRRQAFSEILKMLNFDDLQLIRDVDIRWSSTVLMISRALFLQRGIDRYLSQPDSGLEDYQLSKAEWDALQIFEKILLIPHAFQQILSNEKTPSLGNTIPAFQGLIDAWKKAQDDIPKAADIIQNGIDKLDVYEARLDRVPANILATLLQPRFKLHYFEKKQPQVVEHARGLFLRALQPLYIAGQRDPSQIQGQSSSSAWANDLLGFESPAKQKRARTLEDEIRSYFLDATDAALPAVEFWQKRQRDFPTIFRLALDILPIQGSSVPCERVFSSGKMTTTPRRNKIHHTLMEALQVLKFSIKGGHELSFTAGTSKQDEISELERDTSDPAPEKMSDFIQYSHVADPTSSVEVDEEYDSMYDDD